MTQLDTPLRVTWNLYDSLEAATPAAALAVAAQLVDAGIFYLTLPGHPLAHPEIARILTILSGGGIQVQVAFSGTDEEWQGIAAMAPTVEISIDAGTFLSSGSEEEWIALRRTIERLQDSGYHPALMMVPDRERLPLISQLCVFCRSLGVTRIQLPNTPVDASFPSRSAPLIPDPAQLAALRAQVTDPAALRAGLTMEVHDLFLWEILFPGERESGRSEYGGCQAANSLAHIDPRGTVHPCSSWPHALGSLLERSFFEIWQQSARSVILDRIAAIPCGCAGCSDYPRCFGGCRGLVESLGTSDNGRDLLCSGRRSSPPSGSV